MKTITQTLFLSATLCASALVTRVARADYMDLGQVYLDAGMNMAIHDSIVADIERGAQRKNTGRKTSAPGGARAPKLKAARVTTTYHASPAVIKRVQTRLIALVAKDNSPETVARLKRDLAGDVVGKWAKAVASDGRKRGDVADAMTASWVQSWQVANAVLWAEPAQVRAVRRQLAPILASNAGFAKLSNAQRQEMAEGFIYGQALQGAAYADAIKRGDKALQKQISDGTQAGFKQGMSLDLRAVKLSGAGFAAK